MHPLSSQTASIFTPFSASGTNLKGGAPSASGASSGPDILLLAPHLLRRGTQMRHPTAVPVQGDSRRFLSSQFQATPPSKGGRRTGANHLWVSCPPEAKTACFTAGLQDPQTKGEWKGDRNASKPWGGVGGHYRMDFFYIL